MIWALAKRLALRQILKSTPSLGKLLPLVVAIALLSIGLLVGQQRERTKQTERQAQEQIRTGEAIDNAPVFSPNDPVVIDELCRHAGIADCSVYRNEAKPQ